MSDTIKISCRAATKPSFDAIADRYGMKQVEVMDALVTGWELLDEKQRFNAIVNRRREEPEAAAA